jgi:hypothetical protein
VRGPAAWVLQHRADGVKPFVASFPANTAPADLPSYIILVAGVGRAVLTTVTRRGAAGNQVWVTPSTLATIPDGTSVAYQSANAFQYHTYRLSHDRSKLIAFCGVLIALAGVVIDGTLAIGQVNPIWTVSKETIVGWMGFSMVLKLVGLAVAFLHDEIFKEA